MSHLPPDGCGRTTPRWSTDTALPPASVHAPASAAGLAAASACVGVGPPLFWSGPSCGSVLGWSVAAVSPHVFPVSRLKPSEANVPALALAQVPAMIVFL